jgi:hypothetical protein
MSVPNGGLHGATASFRSHHTKAETTVSWDWVSIDLSRR